MPYLVNRRVLGTLGVLLATQLLSACVVVPPRYYGPRAVIVDGHPGYGAPYPRDYRHPREYRDPRDYRSPRDRGDWDGRR